jgi:hypothetical protein
LLGVFRAHTLCCNSCIVGLELKIPRAQGLVLRGYSILFVGMASATFCKVF